MALTPAQKTTLRAFILQDVTGAALANGGDVTGLLAWLNGERVPAVSAWRVNVPKQSLLENVTLSSFDTLTQGKRDAFRLMRDLSDISALDASKGSVRNGFADIFAVTGTFTDAAQLGKMMNGACIENATRAQHALGFTTPAAVGGVTAIRRNWAELVSPNEASDLAQGI
jgi:hypothetical protein